MTSFFPDVNVWVALSHSDHVHNRDANLWLSMVPNESTILFTRFTQLGLLRLLTNQAAMGPLTLTLGQAWEVYDGWLEDLRITFRPEPSDMDATFRDITRRYSEKPASNSVGDCYVLACAKQSNAVTVTFDKGLLRLARERGYSAISPALSEAAYQ